MVEQNVDQYLAKFNNLAQSFNLTTKEMEDNIKVKVKEIENANVLIPQEDLINVSNLTSDFQIMRQTLLTNIQSAQTLLSQFSQAIIMEGVDIKPQLLSAYSELNESCNSGIKLLSDIYKGIADTHLKIKKLQEIVSDPEEKNISNNLIITDTNELLKKILEKKS